MTVTKRITTEIEVDSQVVLDQFTTEELVEAIHDRGGEFDDDQRAEIERLYYLTRGLPPTSESRFKLWREIQDLLASLYGRAS